MKKRISFAVVTALTCMLIFFSKSACVRAANHVARIANQCSPITFNQDIIKAEYSIYGETYNYGVAYRLYVPTTLNVYINVWYDSKCCHSLPFIDSETNIYDASGRVLASQSRGEGVMDGSRNKMRNSFSMCLNPGYYYIEVWSNSDPEGATIETAVGATLPNRPIIKSVKRKKKTAVVKWSSAGAVSGYQVLRKQGSGNYKVIKAQKGRTYKDKKVKRKKKYYYKVRAYYVYNGIVIYSPASPAKKFKYK